MSHVQLTPEKLKILRHALGISHGKTSTRNYYVAPASGPKLDALIEMRDVGLVEPNIHNPCAFHVTDMGRIAAMHSGASQRLGIDSRAAWVEAHIDRQLSDFQVSAVALLCDAMRRGPYDFAKTFETAQWDYGTGARFKIYRPQLSTYDSDGLTALVLGAHDRSIRVGIDPLTFTHLAITMHPRDKEEGSLLGHHPSIEQVMARRSIFRTHADDGLAKKQASWSRFQFQRNSIDKDQS